MTACIDGTFNFQQLLVRWQAWRFRCFFCYFPCLQDSHLHHASKQRPWPVIRILVSVRRHPHNMLRNFYALPLITRTRNLVIKKVLPFCIHSSCSHIMLNFYLFRQRHNFWKKVTSSLVARPDELACYTTCVDGGARLVTTRQIRSGYGTMLLQLTFSNSRRRTKCSALAVTRGHTEMLIVNGGKVWRKFRVPLSIFCWRAITRWQSGLVLTRMHSNLVWNDLQYCWLNKSCNIGVSCWTVQGKWHWLAAWCLSGRGRCASKVAVCCLSGQGRCTCKVKLNWLRSAGPNIFLSDACSISTFGSGKDHISL